MIAITDHILRQARRAGAAARVATFGRRRYSVTEERFADYLGEIAEEAQRARRLYGMLVLPGAEITQNHVRAKKNAHIVALGIRELHQRGPDDRRHPERDPPPGRAQHRLPSASSDHAPDRDQHLLSLGPPRGARRPGRRVGSRQPRRSVLGDQPEALSLRRQQRLPQAEAPLLVEDAGARREGLAVDQGGVATT